MKGQLIQMEGTQIVVAPHPDDETLGCGGTMLRCKDEGGSIHWLIVTHVSTDLGYSKKRVEQREEEIRRVAEQYGVSGVTNLRFPTTRLDAEPLGDIVEAVGRVFQKIEPEVVYVPYRSDVHTDHAVVFDAVTSSTKWFRYPSVRRVLAYETLSETDFAIDPDTNGFRPNVFCNITGYVDEKVETMQIYDSEIGTHPFPRSEASIRALATLRGSASGFEAAEAFMLLRERIQ
jgi:LmbE family N-acetylglucosaminyl deacetylase